MDVVGYKEEKKLGSFLKSVLRIPLKIGVLGILGSAKKLQIRKEVNLTSMIALLLNKG